MANLNRSNEEVFRDRTRDQPRNLIGHGVWSPRRGRSRRVSAKSSKVAPLKRAPSFNCNLLRASYGTRIARYPLDFTDRATRERILPPPPSSPSSRNVRAFLSRRTRNRSNGEMYIQGVPDKNSWSLVYVYIYRIQYTLWIHFRFRDTGRVIRFIRLQFRTNILVEKFVRNGRSCYYKWMVILYKWIYIKNNFERTTKN